MFNVPYTYLIGWSQYNKYYYGVRFAKVGNQNRKGIPCSEETKSKLREKRKMYRHSKETLAKIKLASQRNANSPEWKQKLKQGIIEKRNYEQWCENLKQARQHMDTPERRKKLSEHMKEVWAKRKAGKMKMPVHGG